MKSASKTLPARRSRKTRASDARPARAARPSNPRPALAERVAAASIAGYVLQLANRA